MKYFPKSRIIYNQKSSLGQFTTPNGKEYVGLYYTTFDGKSFTGANPTVGPSTPLIVVSSKSDFIQGDDISNIKYKNTNPQSPTLLINPTPFTPSPTEEDYKTGKITRYIARQRNGTQFKVMEISKQTHEDLINLRGGANYSLWRSIAIFWQISGPLHNEKINNITTRAGIVDTNQRILNNTEKAFVGIKQYLSDLQQFARVS
jgi:hypothetical protein